MRLVQASILLPFPLQATTCCDFAEFRQFHFAFSPFRPCLNNFAAHPACCTFGASFAPDVRRQTNFALRQHRAQQHAPTRHVAGRGAYCYPTTQICDLDHLALSITEH